VSFFFRPIESLLRQKGVQPEEMEVIIVVNNSEVPPKAKKKGTPEQNAERKSLWSQWVVENQEVLRIARALRGDDVSIPLSPRERELISEIQERKFKIHIIDKASAGHVLPDGAQHVGGARNRGVAEVVERFLSIEKNGLIVQTDADTALADYYIAGAIGYFEQHPDVVGVGGYIETEPIGNAPKEHQTHFFVTAARKYRALVQCAITGSANIIKGGGFSGANMISRAFETAMVGGVPEIEEREDKDFRERLDTIGRTTRVPELLARPADRISLRTGGLTKSHGGMRYHQAREIATSGQLDVRSLETAEVIAAMKEKTRALLEAGSSAKLIHAALTLDGNALASHEEVQGLIALHEQCASGVAGADELDRALLRLDDRVDRLREKQPLSTMSEIVLQRLQKNPDVQERYVRELSLIESEAPAPMLADLDATYLAMGNKLTAMLRAVQG
jgi:hypothetical protein